MSIVVVATHNRCVTIVRVIYLQNSCKFSTWNQNSEFISHHFKKNEKVAHLPWYFLHIPSPWCLYLHATVSVLGLDETFSGHFLCPRSGPVLIAPSGPLGPGWRLKKMFPWIHSHYLNIKYLNMNIGYWSRILSRFISYFIHLM